MSDWKPTWYYFAAAEGRGPILIHSSEMEYACGIASDFNVEWEELELGVDPSRLLHTLRLKDDAIEQLSRDLEQERRMRIRLADTLEAKGVKDQWAKQQHKDLIKAAKLLVVQVYCTNCKISVGDENDVADHQVTKCERCGERHFGYSWEFEL